MSSSTAHPLRPFLVKRPLLGISLSDLGDLKAYIKLTDGATIYQKEIEPNYLFFPMKNHS